MQYYIIIRYPVIFTLVVLPRYAGWRETTGAAAGRDRKQTDRSRPTSLALLMTFSNLKLLINH